jgi:hypothetical protein
VSPAHRFPPPLDRDYSLAGGRVLTRSLEAHVVDHCNLTCAGCCSLSPHLPRWELDPATLERDLARARRVLQPQIFKLVGGEPLLHPRLVDLARVVRRSGIAPRISITTNGLLLERTPDALWIEIDALTISRYPTPVLPAEAVRAITARAARFGVALNWKEQSSFVVMDRPARSDDDRENRAVFADCWLRERCHLLHEGRFYTCTRPPHLSALPGGPGDLTGDGLLIHDGAGLAAELLAYLTRTEPLTACRHCFGGAARLQPHRLLTLTELRARR